jgi:hypothetical protein
VIDPICLPRQRPADIEQLDAAGGGSYQTIVELLGAHWRALRVAFRFQRSRDWPAPRRFDCRLERGANRVGGSDEA